MTEFNPIIDTINILIDTRIATVLKDLCSTHDNLVYEDLIKKYCKKKTSTKKKTLDKCIQCMAKKADGEQCTRRRKTKDNNGDIINPTSEYCGKHIKSRKYGRIDDDEKFKDKSKYIKTTRILIDGEYYLIDEHDRVFSYNKEHPILLGKKIKDKLVLLRDVVQKHPEHIKLKINLNCTQVASK